MTPTTGQRIFLRFWKSFCDLVVKLFYRRFEVSGAETLPDDKGVILCANHVNALADPVIVQASTRITIRPLARSGLFTHWLLRPVLDLIGAVPVYRPGDAGSDVSKNLDSFAKCYELLAQNQTLIIFPEGQSHSDPHLHRLKSGAARMAMGAMAANDRPPQIIPVGLNFSRKGKFRGDVLVQYGEPVDLSLPNDLTDKQSLRLLNKRITEGLAAVTLNADSWDDVDMVRRLERFFALRRGKIRRGNMAQRFHALQRLVEGKDLLLKHEPKRVHDVLERLRRFERLCQRCGIRDYHLTLKYRPWFVIAQSLRMLAAVFIGLPIVLFGYLNGAAPYLLTRHLARKLAKGEDQYDTTKILLGGVLFGTFWAAQLTAIYYLFGLKWMLAYLLALVISAAVAISTRGSYGHIREDIRVFFLFMRQRRLREYLQMKRREIEVELASLVRLAKRLSRQADASA